MASTVSVKLKEKFALYGSECWILSK